MAHTLPTPACPFMLLADTDCSWPIEGQHHQTSVYATHYCTQPTSEQFAKLNLSKQHFCIDVNSNRLATARFSLGYHMSLQEFTNIFKFEGSRGRLRYSLWISSFSYNVINLLPIYACTCITGIKWVESRKLKRKKSSHVKSWPPSPWAAAAAAAAA